MNKFAALCALSLQPIAAAAQVVAAPGSDSRAVVGVTANGLPIVQIATPNAAGVSNNAYTAYNVDKSGLILNNSAANVQTQLGGYVGGNANLAAGGARVILNQVVGGNASQLQGYTEVAGQRAQVIIANPAGIYCNGCGFINTSRSILTTGMPVFGGTGSLDAFHVTGGQIQVGSAGLDGSGVDQVDLIAQSVAINGKVWAGQSLNVVAGNNDVSHSDLSAQSLGPDSNSPSVAIDVAQLGGMYARKITLVGTERGVGVNSAGTIAAQAGDVQVSSQGLLSLSGSTSASENVAISSAGDVANSGAVYATQNTTLNSQGQVTNSGTIAALGDTTVTGATVRSTGALGAGIDANGNVTGTGNLVVSGSAGVTTSGQQMAGGKLSVSGSSVDMTGGQTLANGNALLTATGAAGETGNTGDIVHTGASSKAGGTLMVNAAGTVTNDQAQMDAAQLSVTAAGLSNRSGALSQTGTGDTTLALSGTFDNTAGKVTTNAQNTTLQAGNLSNANGTLHQAGTGALTIQTGTLDNAQGSIATNGAASIATTELQNRAGAITSALALTLASTGDIDNTAAQLEAGGALDVSGVNVQNTAGRIVSDNGDGLTLTASGRITNATGTTAAVTTKQGTASTESTESTESGAVGGVIGGNGDATIHAASLSNSGTVTSAQHLAVTTSGTLDNSGGTLSGATLSSNAASLTNTTGTISANTVSVTVPQLDNSGGTIAANQLDISTTKLTNHNGSLTQVGTAAMSVGVSGTLDNSNGGVIQTNSTDLTLAPSTLNNNGGTITHAGTGMLTIDARHGTGSLKNVGGTIVTNGQANLSADSIDNTSGRIATNQLAVTATNLTNEGGTITQLGTGTMGLGVSGTLDNANGGVIQTNSTDLTLASASVDNNGGTITHTGTGTLTIGSGGGSSNDRCGTISLTNVGGKIVTNGRASLSVDSLDNTGGSLASPDVLSAIVQQTLNNTKGQLSSGTGLSAISGGALLNAGGVIGTGGAVNGSTLTISAASIDNTGGAITNTGNGATTIDGGSQIVNSNASGATGMGSISGNGDVTLSATSIANTQGGQLSGANLQINTSHLDTTGGDIGNVANTTGDVGITTHVLTATNGRINATRNLALSTTTLANGGTYSAVNDLTLTLQGDFTPSSAYRFNAGHDLTFTLPGTFTNGGVLSAANALSITAGYIGNSGTLSSGGLLTTHSNTLTNTGTIVGGSVTLNAKQTLSNLGTRALIGATDSAGTLALLAPDIENRDDTTATDTQASTAIYGLGKVVLAGGVDANGNYVNANRVRNQSALIQSQGDMAIDANQVTNTRRVMTTTGFASSVDPALLASLNISMSGCTAIHMEACSGQDVAWVSEGDPTLIGGAYTQPPHGGQWNSGYQYTTYDGVAVANTIASISPASQILAGGNLNASSVGTFQNYWSQVAATGNIASPATLDQNSWQGQTAPQVQVTYSGQYHYNNYDNSEHNWQLPFGDAPFVGSRPGGYTQAAPADVRTYALPGYESSFTANGTLSGTGVTIHNTAGNAGVTPLGLLPGQTVSGTAVGSVSGSSPAAIQREQTLNSGLANFNNPTIAAATAVKVLNNLTVPTGGLFSRGSAPNAAYLIETNPAFTNQQQWLSSDYYFQQMGMNPGQIQLRLGDGFYEQKLVQNQILSMTGKSVLTNYADTQAAYQALMTSGAQLAKSLDLAPGTGLSPDQVAQLTSNVVIMQTQIVDGKSVLVPVVYLAQASQQNMGNGPVIAATDIDLTNATSVSNSGTIKATNSFALNAQSIDSSNGTLQSGGQMSLATAGDTNLTSATVNAGSLALQAGGDLILSTAAKTLNQVSDSGATRVTTTLGPTASINVGGNAAIVTGGNFEQDAGNLNVGGTLGMNIGGDWNLGVQQTGETKVVARGNGLSDTHLVSNTGSSVNVGGASSIAVGGDLTATGADINLGGGGTVAAGGNVTLQAATATSTVNDNSSGSDRHGSYAETSHLSNDTLTATTLNAGDSLIVASGRDLTVSGSTINLDKGTATLAATGNVNVNAATATHVANAQESHRHSNLVSSTQAASTRDTTSTVSQGSTISADSVAIASGKDINVGGSTIVGTNDVSLAAAHDVNITTSQDTLQSSGSSQEKHSGLGTSGLSVSIGTSKLATTDQQSSVTNNASNIGSLTGSLSIQAGNTLHVTGSNLIAAQNVTGTAANVIVDAATDTHHTSQTEQTSSSGLTIGLAGIIGDAINGAYQQSRALASGNSNGRADALHAIAAAGDAALAGQGVYQAVTQGVSNGGGIGVQVSVGSSHSANQSSEDQTIQRGSSVQAGGTATFVATGNSTPDSGNLTIAGSNVSANDVVLAAKNQVNIVNTTNTDVTQSSNASSGSSVGVSITTAGPGVSASMQNAHGDGNSSGATQNASHVSGANSVTVVSGGDTNILGSQVSGAKVVASVGGNLTIQSVQDTTVSSAHQSSVSGGIGVSTAGGGASFSAQNGHGDATYANVNEQAGIQAGAGGFDINVAGNTGLTGAVIASTSDASKNSLTTGTLTFSDIHNHSHYDAKSNGLSAGGGVANTGKAVGPSSVSDSGGIVPMISQRESGDQSGTTRSAIGAGTISLTNQTAQTQDVTSLSRETSGANGSVSATPDVSNLLSQQADTMQAAQAAGQTVAQGIGAYADKKQKNATAQADADAWAEGGTDRALLHAAGGALVAGLGGGNAIASAVGAGVSSKLAGALNALTNSVASDTGSTLLGNIASNVLAGAAGALVGGSSGAFAAANADFYNRQLHLDERQWAKDHAGDFAAFYEEKTGRTISDAEAQKMLLANGFIRVDQAAASGPGYDNKAAQYITDNAKGLFSRTYYEYTHPNLYGNADGSLSPEQLALPGAAATPGVGIAAAVAIGAGVTAAPAAAVALEACVLNPVLCANEVANLGAEVIASEAMPAGAGAGVAATVGVGKVVAGDVGSAEGAAGKLATNSAATASSAANMTTAAQLRTQLSLQQAGILDSNGQLTVQAIKSSDAIPLSDGVIKNPSVVRELTSDGSNIADWGKYTTQSVTMPNGQSMQVHYYMNSVTGKVDYVTPDFKVKGVVKP